MRFASYLFDQESGFYQVRNRYLHPFIGGWLSWDPLPNAELSQGNNLYWYVGNNPGTRLDPLGLTYSSADEAAKAACACSKEFTDKDKQNIAEANQEMKDAGVPSWVRVFGYECAGLICQKCDQFSYTGPVEGGDAMQTADVNDKAALTYGIYGSKPGVPPLGWAGSVSKPSRAPKCSTLGKGWKQIATFHSHPGNEPFSQADKNHEIGDVTPRYVTRCGGKGQPTDKFVPSPDPKDPYNAKTTTV